MRSSKSSKSSVIFLVVAILVVVNGIGFLVYSRSGDDGEKESKVETLAATGDDKEQAKELVIEGKVEELRKRAIQHLVDDEFEEAVGKLSEALTLTSDQKDLPQLLSLAKQQLQGRRQEELAAEVSIADPIADPSVQPGVAVPTPPEDTPSSIQPNSRRRPAKMSRADRAREKDRKARLAASNRKPDSFVDEPQQAKMGTLAVISTPSVAFTVDGAAAGVTPRNVAVTAGSKHVITYLYRGRSIARRSQSVDGGKTAFVSADLTEDIAALTKPAEPIAVVEPKPVVAAKPKPVVAAKPKPAVVKAKEYGELFVVSPNLYGEIYVNGKGYGKPPRVIKNLPVGPVKVEIRVQGKARRAKIARVTKGKRAKLRFR